MDLIWGFGPGSLAPRVILENLTQPLGTQLGNKHNKHNNMLTLEDPVATLYINYALLSCIVVNGGPVNYCIRLVLPFWI